jgi:hypothetical protein
MLLQPRTQALRSDARSSLEWYGRQNEEPGYEVDVAISQMLLFHKTSYFTKQAFSQNMLFHKTSYFTKHAILKKP